ncbi:Phosphatidylinositol-binding clathrin assembly protein LAP [Fragariocoptes setiger]|uniref:Phosphatidylinositol-binding clathrin assembly protein LAP n=1 Tax=Fragariocoptes setiger TaxID=1670756 RepID=A0ABQ7S8Q7_9ACAR|nr:Phosphatidylinositol-binding clathrin assembly protein LAP [Fragariocoptes setiger]
MAARGQTINDRLNAAKYALAGQALARCVCKATTEEPIAPKKKHLDYLIMHTLSANSSIPQMANLLIERASNNSSWVVVMKALITIHHLMSFGHERFSQYMSSSNFTFQLNGFLDRYTNQGYTMSPFVRRYSNYINAKALTYRKLAFDPIRIKRGPDNVMRKMPVERLIKTLPVIQSQMDTLLEFDCTSDDLSNSVIVSSFILLFRDLVKLYASYNDGIINLLEKYFNLNKNLARPAFDIYKNFTLRLDKISTFLRVAEHAGINRGEIPDLKQGPASLIDALEGYLESVEKRKEPARSPSLRTTISLGKAQVASIADGHNDWAADDPWATNLENSETLEALEEEARAIQQFERRTSLARSERSNRANESTSESLDAFAIHAPPSNKNPFNPFVTQSVPDDPWNEPAKKPEPKATKEVIGFDSNLDDFDPRAGESTSNTKPINTLQQTEPDPFGFQSTNQEVSNKHTFVNSFNTQSLPRTSPSSMPLGYSSTLLRPVQVTRPRMDPSIDLQTQQQLQQIRQEQELLREQLSQSSAPVVRPVNHPRSEKIKSAFEDLELVMRQSMAAVKKLEMANLQADKTLDLSSDLYQTSVDRANNMLTNNGIKTSRNYSRLIQIDKLNVIWLESLTDTVERLASVNTYRAKISAEILGKSADTNSRSNVKDTFEAIPLGFISLGVPVLPTLTLSELHQMIVEQLRSAVGGFLSIFQHQTKNESSRETSSGSNNLQRVFISYVKSEAAAHALNLKWVLNNQGISAYLDVHEIRNGSDWYDSLNNAVQNRLVFIPLITSSYGMTQWSNREVKLADILNKKILPVNFGQTWPPPCLAIQFATTQYICWRTGLASCVSSKSELDNCSPSKASDNNSENDRQSMIQWLHEDVLRVAQVIEQT